MKCVFFLCLCTDLCVPVLCSAAQSALLSFAEFFRKEHNVAQARRSLLSQFSAPSLSVCHVYCMNSISTEFREYTISRGSNENSRPHCKPVLNETALIEMVLYIYQVLSILRLRDLSLVSLPFPLSTSCAV